MIRYLTALAVCCALAWTAGAGTLYRWVDENGRVHYSDRPHEGAERIDMPRAQTFSAPPVPQQQAADPAPAEGAAEAGEPLRYESIAVVSPSEQEVLWNIGTVLSVSLDLQPGLQPGHSVQVSLDGSVVGSWPAGSLSATIEPVYRGTHTLRATVVGDNGSELISSDAVTFYVQQTTIRN